MLRRATLWLVAAGLAAATAVPGMPAVAADDAAAAQRSGPKARLARFDDCGQLVRYARRHALDLVRPGRGLPFRPVPGAPFVAPGLVPAGGGEGGGRAEGQVAPSPTGGGDGTPGFSPTNVQEEGVDEPDIVKTDGATLFVAAEGGVHAIDVRDGTPRLVGFVQVEGTGLQLLLSGDRLLAVGRRLAGGPRPVLPGAGDVNVGPIEGSVLTEVDVGAPSAMRVLHALHVEGGYVDARLHGRSARIVLSTPPRPFEDAAEIRRAGLAAWRPRGVLRTRRAGRGPRRALVSCTAVRRPATFSGLGTLTVLTVDLARGLPAVDADAILADAHTVYASADSLYVATERWTAPGTPVDDLPAANATTIHRFALAGPDRTDYRVSGHVRGHVLNAFSLSEHGGVLRVATTDEPAWWSGDGSSESFVTVLAERDGTLAQVGRVGGLGRGERIYAVRFIGDKGYVVTFRQTDPLYTLDLSDPAAPAVLGELKILGYSAYLHPLGGDLLLGVGQDATPEGRTRGTQLSLFDVANPRAPALLHQRALGLDSESEAELDHHAFLWWEPAALAVVPVETFGDEDASFAGAVGFRVDRQGGIAEAGRVTHGTAPDALVAVRRALVVGDRLLTVSELGVRSSALDSLADVAWAPFAARRTGSR